MERLQITLPPKKIGNIVEVLIASKPYLMTKSGTNSIKCTLASNKKEKGHKYFWEDLVASMT